MKQKSTQQEEIVMAVSTAQGGDLIQSYQAKARQQSNQVSNNALLMKSLLCALQKIQIVKQVQNTRMHDSEAL